MKFIKVSEATPIQLDWLVAKCNGDFALYHNLEEGQRFLNLWTDSAFLKYSTLWGCGGPIIDLEGITLRCGLHGWDAELEEFDAISHGPTALIAAMRCFVASRLGDTVEVPEELE